MHKLIGPRQKNYTRNLKGNPLYFFDFILQGNPLDFLQKNSLKNFTGKSFYFFSTFRLILKKSYQEGVFDFFYPDPQLDQNIKPTRNLSGHIYIYIGIYIYI